MKYCSTCGKELVDESIVCTDCGVLQISDSGSIGYFFLGFFIPIVGIILYFVWKGLKPKSSKKAGLGALTGIIISIILIIAYLALVISIIHAALSVPYMLY
ncbi:MAG: hypothetical protein ATN31_08835 [Candidatus Epulonipiscioides saccharophilum]|nr:MAG: hypothetical protein ATN31_08835 [Epulopiscium sp. AS2M-Bin001]